MVSIPAKVITELRKSKTGAHRVCDSLGGLWDWYVASEIDDPKLHSALARAVDDACNAESLIGKALTRITELGSPESR